MNSNSSIMGVYDKNASPFHFAPPSDLTATCPATATEWNTFPNVGISIYDGTMDVHSQTMVSNPTFSEQSIVVETHIPFSSVEASTQERAVPMTRTQQLQQKMERSKRQLEEINEDIRQVLIKHGMQELPKGSLVPAKNIKKLSNQEIEFFDQSKKYVKKYNATLTQYNDMKDAAMILLSMTAEKEGKPLKSILEERGITTDD